MTAQTELMTETDFATRMVARYRDLLLQAAGLKQITIDGQVVSYADLELNYRSWTDELSRLTSSRPRVMTIDLSNG